MTVLTAANKVVAAGNGVATVFSFGFVGAAAADIGALFTDAAGNQTALSQGPGTGQFQVSLNAAAAPALWGVGGTVTYNPSGTPIATGTTLTILRTLPLTQPTSLQNQASFGQYASAAEMGLDQLEMQIQQLNELYGRAITVNAADPAPAPLPPVASRALQNASFDAAGNMIAGGSASATVSVAMQPFVASATLAAAKQLAALPQWCGTSGGAANAQTLTVAGITAYQPGLYTFKVGPNLTNTAAPQININSLGLVAVWDGQAPLNRNAWVAGCIVTLFYDGVEFQQVGPSSAINVDARWFGVKADGTTDDAAALQAAVNAANGGQVQLPPGTIVLKTQVAWLTTGAFAPGLKLQGAGLGVTIIDNQVVSGSCLYSASSQSGNFQLGGYIRDLKIITTTGSAAAGIEHKAAYQYEVSNVWVIGLAGDGMRITCALGDADAANEMHYRTCRIENCNIGLNCNFSAGVTQPSFLRLDDCFFSGSAIGLRYIGLQGIMINCAFVIHTNVALQFVNNGSSNAQFTGLCNSFENNAKNIQIDSLQGGTFVQTEFASGVGPVQATSVVFTSAIGIQFTGSRIRISSTPHTLWTFAAGGTGNQISNSFYQNYDGAGQVRYSVNASAFGNRLDDSFDSIQGGSQSGTTSIACVNGANVDVALPIDGALWAVGGPSGAFSISGLTNGFPGRRLTLLNNSGQVMTLTYEGGGSAAANRLAASGGSDVVVNNLGSVILNYTGSRWYVLGK